MDGRMDGSIEGCYKMSSKLDGRILGWEAKNNV